MKRDLISPADRFGRGQARVVVPLLVEKLHRSIWLGAPSQRGDGVDDTPEAIVGLVRFGVCLAEVFVGTEVRDRFCARFAVFECAIYWVVIFRDVTQMRVPF